MNTNKISIILQNNLVTIIFIFLSIIGIYYSGYSAEAIIQEIIDRTGRNMFLLISLLIPILAGMGLNFAMTLGAMAGQIALIFITDWQIGGITGISVAMIMSVPLSIVLGYFCGYLLNKAKGKEMITSYMLGFFVNGLYQLFVLYAMGNIIKINSDNLLLSRGYGVRNTVNLDNIRKSLDNFMSLKINNISIPFMTIIFFSVLGLGILWFKKTKLGQNMRAIAGDMSVATSSGINVNKTRIIAIIISTVLAGIGQIIFLQNMGTINTYTSHDQVGMYSCAALLVGGASVNRANIRNVLLGVILFHTLFMVAPNAGKNLIGSAQLGEYFRNFISFAVIGLALVLYTWRDKKNN